MRIRQRRRVKVAKFDERGVTVYTVLMGPFEPCIRGTVYDMTVLEGKHGWIETVSLADKSAMTTADSILDTMRDVMNRSNQTLNDISRCHTDQGNEFKKPFDTVLRELSITHTDTGGYNSCVNPVENAQGRLQQTARSMLTQATGGHNYYHALRSLVVSRAAYCLNRTDRDNKPSPYSKAWGKAFVWGPNEHSFGARCLYKTNNDSTDKYESKGEVGIWAGYNKDSNQHYVVPLEAWDPVEQNYQLGKLVSVGTVKVYEDQFPLRCIPLGKDTPDIKAFNDFVDRFDPKYQHKAVKGDKPIEVIVNEAQETEYKVKGIIGTKHRGRSKNYIVEWEGGAVTIEPSSGLHPELTEEYELKLAAIEYAHAALVADLNDIQKMVTELIPKQNVKGDVSDWEIGVKTEWDTVSDLRFEEVDETTRVKVLRECNAMKLRMILEHKKDGRRKGRLVGQGFWEDVGVTGSNIDSPVASFAAVRMLMFMSGGIGEVIATGDVSKAFLMADEYPADSEPRYVRFKMHKDDPERVYRLKGPLYGSRDSPKLWYESFKRFMTTVSEVQGLGFEIDTSMHKETVSKNSDKDTLLNTLAENTVNTYIQGANDPCCFINPVTGVKVALFVDDIISRGMPEETKAFYSKLNEKYALRSWSILSPENPLKHLGFDLTEEVIEGETYRYMSQGDDVRRFLTDNSLEFTYKVDCPMPDKNHILKGDDAELTGDDLTLYKSLCGSMSWFSISLRWDICHAVSRLQQSKPTKGALNAAIRVAGYLSSTADFKVGGKVCYGKTKVKYYSDSDYIGDRGVYSTCSQSGVMLMMNNIPVHWRSKKQPKTVLSPAHAEIYACSEAVKEAMWLQWVACDLGLDLSNPVTIHVDNSQVVSFKYSTCSKSRLKMIDARWNWVQELRDDNLCSVVHVPTKLNLADILTKCLRGPEFRRQVEMVQRGG
jgi:hypothetical protein